jgi:hypothetical protein
MKKIEQNGMLMLIIIYLSFAQKKTTRMQLAMLTINKYKLYK